MAASDRPPSRIVFVVLGGPLTLLLIAVTALVITGTVARQSESTAIVFTDSITTLRIDIAKGSITLRGGELSTVTGERITTRGIQAPSFTERVEGSTLVIESSCTPIGNTWCDVSYVLDVPRSITVEAQTAVGRIRADGLSGPARLRSATGSVTAENGSGPLRLESGAGSVTASGLTSQSVTAASGAGSVDLDFAAPPTSVDAGSGAGSVEIVVPRDGTTYRIDERDHDGQDLRIAVPTDPASPNVIAVGSGAGGVSVHHPEAG